MMGGKEIYQLIYLSKVAMLGAEAAPPPHAVVLIYQRWYDTTLINI
jgi:hypothetical protein